MTRIIADISVCLDGFVTGPDPSPDDGLVAGGEVGKPASVVVTSSPLELVRTAATHLTYDVFR
jgi:hypothetical protein